MFVDILSIYTSNVIPFPASPIPPPPPSPCFYEDSPTPTTYSNLNALSHFTVVLINWDSLELKCLLHKDHLLPVAGLNSRILLPLSVIPVSYVQHRREPAPFFIGCYIKVYITIPQETI